MSLNGTVACPPWTGPWYMVLALLCVGEAEGLDSRVLGL